MQSARAKNDGIIIPTWEGRRRAGDPALAELLDVGVDSLSEFAPVSEHGVLLDEPEAALAGSGESSIPIFVDGSFRQRNAVRITFSDQPAQDSRHPWAGGRYLADEETSDRSSCSLFADDVGHRILSRAREMP
jgi:hypothetical protein